MNIKIIGFAKMTTLELYDCLKLRSDVFVVEQECIYPDIDFSDKTSNHLLAIKENELIGYLRINSNDKFIAKIERVIIAKEYRGLGYAKQIISKAINFVKYSTSNKIIKISAQEYLKDFYQSFLFKQKGTSYFDYGIEHIDMKLNLKN